MAVFNTIATSVKTVLDAVAAAPTTVIRKRDIVHKFETLPIATISFGGQDYDEWAALGPGSSTDQGSIGKAYAIWVSVYRENAGNLDTTLSTNPDFFQAAVRALNKANLSGASEVWNTQVETNEAWESQPFRDGAEVSRLRIIFQSSEVRNT